MKIREVIVQKSKSQKNKWFLWVDGKRIGTFENKGQAIRAKRMMQDSKSFVKNMEPKFINDLIID